MICIIRRISYLVVCSLIWFTGYVHAAAWEAPIVLDGATPITAEELADLIKGMNNLILIDTRRHSDFKSGTIEGSVSLPSTQTSPGALANVIPDKTTPIVFYCGGLSCSKSMKSVKKAVSYGYVNIFWFRGGLSEWRNKGFPVTTETP